MSGKIELKSQIYSAVHYLLKTTGADFRQLDSSTESLIFENKNAIGNLKRFAGFGKKSQLKFAMSITANTEADERKNRAEISIIFSWSWCAEIDRDWFSWRWKIKFFDGIANLTVVEKKAHLNFAISIAVNTEADERKNRAEISKIFSRPLSAEIDRGWFSG